MANLNDSVQSNASQYNPPASGSNPASSNDNNALGNHRSGQTPKGSIKTTSRPTPGIIKAGQRARIGR